MTEGKCSSSEYNDRRSSYEHLRLRILVILTVSALANIIYFRTITKKDIEDHSEDS